MCGLSALNAQVGRKAHLQQGNPKSHSWCGTALRVTWPGPHASQVQMWTNFYCIGEEINGQRNVACCFRRHVPGCKWQMSKTGKASMRQPWEAGRVSGLVKMHRRQKFSGESHSMVSLNKDGTNYIASPWKKYSHQQPLPGTPKSRCRKWMVVLKVGFKAPPSLYQGAVETHEVT